MKLTPLEIKQQTFEKAIRGYDTADVNAFLALMANEFEQLITKNRELEHQIEKLADRVKHYEGFEDALHETLRTAKESVEQKIGSAKVEARSKVEMAEAQAAAIISEANNQRQQIRQSILRLLDRRQEIINGISAYLENAQHSVQQFSKDELGLFQLPKEEKLDENIKKTKDKPSSKFTYDAQVETPKAPSIDEENGEEHAFPPGSDRLDDILDEID